MEAATGVIQPITTGSMEYILEFLEGPGPTNTLSSAFWPLELAKNTFLLF